MLWLSLILWFWSVLPICPADVDSSNNDYFSIGAHLNADAFAKHLRKWFDSRLQIDFFREHLSNQKWETATLNLETVQELTGRLDTKVDNLASNLLELVAPMSGSYISCHSIHELVRLSPTQPCAIRASDTGTPPKFKLEPLLHPLIQQQFVLSEDVLFEFPAEFLPPRIHSGPIVSTLIPIRKNIVLLLDSGSLSIQEQVDTVRLVANQLIDVISYNDQFGVYLTSGQNVKPLGCGGQVLWRGERQNLDEIKMAIHNLEPPAVAQPTDHGSVLSKLISLLNGTDPHRGKTILTYISRGVLENLEDAASAVRRVNEVISHLRHPIRINTLLLSDERRSTSFWSTQFMDNLARRNNSKENKNSVEGLALTIEKNMMLDLYDVQELLDWEDQAATEDVVVTLPTSSHRTIVMTKYLYQNESDLVAGMEIHLPSLLTPFFHNLSLNLPGIQAHLVTEDGLIIFSSIGWEDVPLSAVDDWKSASKWLEHSWEGSGGEFEVKTNSNKTYFYIWSKLQTIPAILIVRSEIAFPRTRRFLANEKKLSSSLRHIVPHQTVKDSILRCSQFGREVIPGTASLYLPPYVSTYPVTDHWLFLTDTVGMIPSKGLKNGIREQVSLISGLVDQWITFFKMDEHIILKKFAATTEGILVVYPAAEVTKKYDPKKQEWFLEAVAKSDSVVITGPRQDPLLGDLVIVSIAIPYKKEVFAVLGIEIPASFLGKLLKESVASCTDSRQCILFSKQGKVVFSDKAYPSSDVVERFHISHLEPLLTSDMTSNQKLVKKTLCQYGTITRRQFEWNMEYSRVHTTPCGDVRRGGSVSSEVLAVPGTQFLLAMVNTTCIRTPVTVFCPCSVHDGRCLFCGKFDSLECECPCTCPGCVDRSLPFCPISPQNDLMIVTSGIKEVPICSRIECTSLLHYDACISTSGCSWCQYSSSLATLNHPQCRSSSMCYGGVFGRNPTKTVEPIQQTKWLTPTPIGPLVAGFVLALIVVIGAAWCYRNYAQRIVIHNCNHSVDSAPLFGPTAEIECDPTIFKEERIPVALTFFDREVVSIPPAPPSDHGYSTMTEKNDDATSAVSTTITDQLSSIVSKSAGRRLEPPLLPPMTSLITMAEVHEEPGLTHQLIC